MPAKYKDTDYMYSSARLRALETKMLGREGCERLLSAENVDEMLEVLADFGYRTVRKQDATSAQKQIGRPHCSRRSRMPSGRLPKYCRSRIL